MRNRRNHENNHHIVPPSGYTARPRLCAAHASLLARRCVSLSRSAARPAGGVRPLRSEASRISGPRRSRESDAPVADACAGAVVRAGCAGEGAVVEEEEEEKEEGEEELELDRGSRLASAMACAAFARRSARRRSSSLLMLA